ncbi:unnamed protein product, partial [Amoebophrya sp. A25]|eukprot:GSA25T00023952001.1
MPPLSQCLRYASTSSPSFVAHKLEEVELSRMTRAKAKNKVGQHAAQKKTMTNEFLFRKSRKGRSAKVKRMISVLDHARRFINATSTSFVVRERDKPAKAGRNQGKNKQGGLLCGSNGTARGDSLSGNLVENATSHEGLDGLLLGRESELDPCQGEDGLDDDDANIAAEADERRQQALADNGGSDVFCILEGPETKILTAAASARERRRSE